MRRLALLVALVATVTAAWAEPAARIGPRAGVELRDGAHAVLGVDLRLAFMRTPLIIEPALEDVLDAKLTLYRLSIDALYYPRLRFGRLEPYVGIGVTVTTFAYKQATTIGDDNGNRMGMNLVAGTSFALPIAMPFVQVAKGFGEFSGFAFVGGLAFALEHPQ